MLSLLLGNLGGHPAAQSQAAPRLFQHRAQRVHPRRVIGAAAALPGILPRPQMADINTGQVAVSVYLVSYLLATFTCFIVLALLRPRLAGPRGASSRRDSRNAPRFWLPPSRSRSSRWPGFPPLSGFIAKALVVLVAWNRGLYVLLFARPSSPQSQLSTIILGPIKAMYWSEPLDRTPITRQPPGHRGSLHTDCADDPHRLLAPIDLHVLVNGATLAPRGRSGGFTC